MSKRRAGIMTPKISEKQNTLFMCGDCYCSIKKTDCTSFFYCEKCKVRLCIICYNKSKICINGCKKLTIFVKKDEIRTPENLESFNPVIPEKNNYWCCYF